MVKHILKARSIQHILHNVQRIVVAKPQHYKFTQGQATEISINKSGWEDEKRPFIFTSLPDSDYLEFTIKTCPAHLDVINQLLL